MNTQPPTSNNPQLGLAPGDPGYLEEAVASLFIQTVMLSIQFESVIKLLHSKGYLVSEELDAVNSDLKDALEQLYGEEE